VTWALVAALALGTFALRAGGLAGLGHLRLPPFVVDVLSWCPVAIIAALVVVGALGGPTGGIELDARAVGLAAGLAAVALRAPFLVVFGVAVGVTVLVRAMS
jgi:branched-subunit amino acid transport protein